MDICDSQVLSRKSPTSGPQGDGAGRIVAMMQLQYVRLLASRLSDKFAMIFYSVPVATCPRKWEQTTQNDILR